MNGNVESKNNKHAFSFSITIHPILNRIFPPNTSRPSKHTCPKFTPWIDRKGLVWLNFEGQVRLLISKGEKSKAITTINYSPDFYCNQFKSTQEVRIEFPGATKRWCSYTFGHKGRSFFPAFTSLEKTPNLLWGIQQASSRNHSGTQR